MQTVTYAKAVRDGEVLRRHARVVVLLDIEGNIKEILNRKNGWLISVIAVLGPSIVEGKLVRQAVRSEIGLERGVPYRPSERIIHDMRVRIIDRSPILLSEDEVHQLIPNLVAVIQSFVDREVMGWKRLTYTKKLRHDSKESKFGRFITIPPDLEYFVFLSLAKDIENRIAGHLRLFIRNAKLNLSQAKWAYYEPGELKKQSWSQHVALVLTEANYGTYFFEVIRRSLGNEGTKVRALFEQVLEVFKIRPDSEKDKEYLRLREVYPNITRSEIKSFPLDVMVHTKRIMLREKRYPNGAPLYRHAQQGLRVEIRPSDAAIEKHAIQQEQRILAESKAKEAVIV